MDKASDITSVMHFMDHLAIAIYVCDNSGRIVYYNAAAAKLWGRTPATGHDQWCGAFKLMSPNGDTIEPACSPVAMAIKQEVAFDNEEVIIERPDGEKLNIQMHSMPVYDVEHKLTHVVSTLVDVTEQRKGEAKQAMLAAIIESSDDAIISKNLNGIITSWNIGAERMFGYTEAEMIGKPIVTIIPSDYRNDELMILSKIRNNERVEHFETMRLTKSGSLIPVSLTISPIKDKNGTVIGASKIARDISRQKDAEKTLLQNAGNLETMNNLGKLISQTLDIDKILQNVTDATTQLTGAEFGAFFYNTTDNNNEAYMLYTLSGAPKEVFEKLGMPRNTDIFKPTFAGEGIIRVDDIRKDERYGKNAPYYGMPKGHLPVVSYLAVPVVSKDGTVIGGLFYGHPQPGKFTKEHEDLVSAIAVQAAIALDNAKLYEEVRQLSEKKDEFISQASHELKTPITSLNGFLQLIDSSLETDDQNKDFIKIALKQVKKLSNLVSDLLDVSKLEGGKLPLSFTHFDLVQLTREVVTQFQYSVKSHTIELNFKQDDLFVYADKQRIEQVIINLLSNAVKYSPRANVVKVETHKEDHRAILAIRDFGIGIKEELQEHIFSRFYRVEDQANQPGLGIGLYICKEIIHRHNGHLYVESSPAEGSIFWFDIPIEQKASII
ncbi:PAS domain S-box protein [Chitinophagaceae bacterium DXS]|nr:PAS domain S-box protein [Chitinophagaceae bacterium DXS]